MAKTRGTGLLMLWTDTDAEHEEAFDRWYEEEHLDRLLKVQGFLSAARNSLDRYVFELTTTDGLVSRRYRAAFRVVSDRMRVAEGLARQLQALGPPGRLALARRAVRTRKRGSSTAPRFDWGQTSGQRKSAL
jgi:hypothetical protein